MEDSQAAKERGTGRVYDLFPSIFWKWSRLQLIEKRATWTDSNITSDLSVKISPKMQSVQVHVF